MAGVLALMLLSLSVVLCRPSDIAQQDSVNDWNNFNQMNDFIPSRQSLNDHKAEIGNDISNFLGSNNNNNNVLVGQRADKAGPGEEEALRLNETVLSDPCYGVRCRKGKMCAVIDETTNATDCVCPTHCPARHAPVCSTLGIQYNSTCVAHMENCRLETDVEIAYNEPCIAKQGPCVEADLSQFPIRFLEWMMHIRQAEVLGKTDPNSSVRRLTDTERFSVSKWMFGRVDLERDNRLQSYDLEYLLRQLLPVEHCIDEFLDECDADKSGELTMFEWNNCLMPGTNSVENNFFEDI